MQGERAVAFSALRTELSQMHMVSSYNANRIEGRLKPISKNRATDKPLWLRLSLFSQMGEKMVHQSPPETTTIPSVCVINKDSSKGWVVLTRHLCSFELYEGVESHKVKAFTRQKQQKVVRNPRGSALRIHFKGTNAGHKIQVTEFFFSRPTSKLNLILIALYLIPYNMKKKRGVQVCKSQKYIMEFSVELWSLLVI